MFGVAPLIFAARDTENARIPEVFSSPAADPAEKRSDNLNMVFPGLSRNSC
jgi:hypothetical protein